MAREWTDEQRKAASDRMKARNEQTRTQQVSQSMRRVPVGGQRDITTVKDTPDGFVDRWVNDNSGRVDKFKSAGYEHVTNADVGDSNVDGTHAANGIVSKDMGQGVTAYLMRQRDDWFGEDQKVKQVVVDDSENAMRRDRDDNRNDGHYGEVTIGRST